jgi:DNA-binding NarL/FixJ family response regulator
MAILIVDDHPLLRVGIVAVVNDEKDMQVVAQAGNGVEAIERFRQHLPDVTLMDLAMPKMDGLEAAEAIRAEWPQARIVMLTTYSGDAKALRALKAGASGYLLKSLIRTDLLSAIRSVHAGQRRIPREVADTSSYHRHPRAARRERCARERLMLHAGGSLAGKVRSSA